MTPIYAERRDDPGAFLLMQMLCDNSVMENWMKKCYYRKNEEAWLLEIYMASHPFQKSDFLSKVKISH